MASLFRSEEMAYLQAIIPEEAAHSFAHHLASVGCTQLVDMNSDQSAFQRRFTKDIMRITEIERKCSSMEATLTAQSIPFVKAVELAEEAIQEAPHDMVERVQVIIDKYYNDLQEVTRVVTDLEASLEQANEFDAVLSHTGKLLRHRGLAEEAFEERKQEAARSKVSNNVPLVEIDTESQQLSRADQFGFQYLAGIVSKPMRPVLERQVFLVSRGNVFSLFSDIENDDSRSAFILFFLGGNLRRKLARICETMGVRLYLYPENSGDVQMQRSQNSKQIADLNAVLNHTKKQQSELLGQIARRIGSWKKVLVQEKALFTAMNKMKSQSRNLVAQLWVPVEDQGKVQDSLDFAVAGRGLAPPVLSAVPTKSMPPTFFRTNSFTSTFQNIVNTYGVPRYREVNPALFTIVTFPFLFAMMYGDIGHGSGLLLFGLYLCYNAKSMAKSAATNEMLGTLHGGRYLLTMMGAFAVYVGLVYNDCMSIALNLFGSRYEFEEESDRATHIGGVYPFGIDPAWHGTSTELAFYNSLKMKLSVIIGIIQMTFGIILSAYNHVYFKNYISIWCEFIPQMIFMMSFFGYMIVLILVKWSIDWSIPYTNGFNLDGTPCAADPPNLITTLINMVLNIGVVECKSELYKGQAQMQSSLVSFALISVPWMLIPKPAILYFLNWKKQNEKAARRAALAHQRINDEEAAHGPEHEHAEEEHDDEDDGHGGHGHGPFNFGEICIHQMIHTIEFVLGTVSNTASYLRLWALSLAHAELAKVFFEKVLYASWMTGSGISVVIGTAMFIGATVMVLMAMDVLECFLHALRLHWVEFQNKFFAADGVAFSAFSYKAALEEESK